MARARITRRDLLLGAVGAAGATATAGGLMALRGEDRPDPPPRIEATSEEVRRAEELRRRKGTGRTVRARLVARRQEIDLGGTTARTWTYDRSGEGIRCTAGDELSVEVRNELDEPHSVHWHGLRLRNDMDGVSHLTQPLIEPGGRRTYTFIAPDAGTYWFHSHHGVQRERGLFAPLIIDDPRDPGDHDVEFTVVLDDWTDGAAATPDDILAALKRRGMGKKYTTRPREGVVPPPPATWSYDVPAKLDRAEVPERLADEIGYPFYLLNWRLPTAPHTFTAKPGQRAKIRLINAGGATVFRVALGGHRLTATHNDGFPIEPVTVDTVQVGSGERIDLRVTLGDGAFPLVGVAEGKNAQAVGVVRTAGGAAPPADAQPGELAGRLLRLKDLRATEPVRLEGGEPDVRHTLYLTGSMNDYVWRINAETYNAEEPFEGISPLAVRQGERVRLDLANQTPMYHPMHLHGHTFQLHADDTIGAEAGPPLRHGARKDTVLVGPGQRVSVDFTADNPGQWLTHCHNAYHLASGMATIVSYLRPQR